MKIKAIRDLKDSELKSELANAREEIRKARFQFTTARSLENPKLIREQKKKIARILTIQKEREKKK